MTTPVAPKPWEVAVAGGHLRGGTWPAAAAHAPTVLALHDIGGNHRWWVKVARLLAGSCTIVAPDLRGRGLSDGLLGPAGLDAHLDDLRIAIASLDTSTRPLLVGHGTGSLLASHLVQAGPPHSATTATVVGVGTPPDAATLVAHGTLAARRLVRPLAHRSDDLAWWRAQPGLRTGLDAEARWAVSGDVVGHGFGWRVQAAAREVQSLVDDLASAAPSALAPPHHEIAPPRDRDASDGPTALLRDDWAAAVAAALSRET